MSYLSSSGSKSKYNPGSKQAIKAFGERTPNQSAHLQGHRHQKRCSLAQFQCKWNPEYVAQTKEKEVELMRALSINPFPGMIQHTWRSEELTVKSCVTCAWDFEKSCIKSFTATEGPAPAMLDTKLKRDVDSTTDTFNQRGHRRGSCLWLVGGGMRFIAGRCMLVELLFNPLNC